MKNCISDLCLLPVEHLSGFHYGLEVNEQHPEDGFLFDRSLSSLAALFSHFEVYGACLVFSRAARGLPATVLLRKHRKRQPTGCVFMYDWPNLQFQISDLAYHSSSRWMLFCFLTDGSTGTRREIVTAFLAASLISSAAAPTISCFLTLSPSHWRRLSYRRGFPTHSSCFSALRDEAASTLKVNPDVWV